jgi:hypothetical protein
MKAVMQLDSIEPAIHYPFEHLPNRLEKSNPTVVPSTLWYQSNYAPKELAGDDAMGPDCLNQYNEQPPILPFSLIPLAFRVILLQDAPKPHLNMFGTPIHVYWLSGKTLAITATTRLERRAVVA